MKYEIRFEAKAERDILNASRYYEHQRAGLGHYFLDRIKETLEMIENQPKIFPVVHRNYRRALLKQFPHSIYYCLNHQTILVSAVLHQRQNQEILE